MSFDNLNNNANLKKVNLFLMIILTAASSAVLVLLPFASFAGLAFIPVPAILLIMLNRVKDAIICAVAGLLFLFIFNYMLALSILFAVILLAFSYRYMHIKEKPLYFKLLTVFLIFVFLVFLYFLLSSAIMRQNTIREFLSIYNLYVDGLPEDPFIRNYQNIFLMSSSQMDSTILQMQSILRFIPKIIIGLMIVYFGIASILNYLFSFLLLKRFALHIKPLPLFKNWDIPWYWCWGVIAGIIMIIIPSNIMGDYAQAINAIGYNLVIISGFIYFILGTAVFWGILDRFRVKNSIKTIILLAGFFLLGFIFLLPLLGLIDIWANFRKLERSH